MGIPHTDQLMPVLHIIPVNEITHKIISYKDVMTKPRENNGPDYFDLAATYNLISFSFDAKDQSVSIEFIDPTFEEFESIMTAINRDSLGSLIGQMNFQVTLGWAFSNKTARDVIYPLKRDLELRTGKRLKIIKNELLAEPFYCCIKKIQYAVQGSGIRYTLTGPGIYHSSELLFAQNDAVSPRDCTYYTLFYYLASRMNVLIMFDESVDLEQLNASARSYAFENKTNMDNFERLINTVNEENGGAEGYKVLQFSISSREEDAKKAIEQTNRAMKSALPGIKQSYENIANGDSLKNWFAKFTSPDVLSIQTGAQFANWILGNESKVKENLPIFDPVATVVKTTSAAIVDVLTKSDREKKLLFDSLSDINSHWGKVSSQQVKDWKTYIISSKPSMIGEDRDHEPIMNPDSSVDLRMPGKKFLGVYSSFGKDIEKMQPSDKGMEASVGFITSSAFNIDDTMGRMYQRRAYAGLDSSTGNIVRHVLDLALMMDKNKTPFNVFKRRSALTMGVTNPVQNTINGVRGNSNSTLQNSVQQLGIKGSLNSTSPTFMGLTPGFADEERTFMPYEEILKWGANQLGLGDDASLADINNASKSKIDELTNKYFKNSSLPSFIYNDVVKYTEEYIANRDDKAKYSQWVHDGINPTSALIKVINQVTFLKELSGASKEQQRVSHEQARFLRAGIVLNLKTVGDIGITSDLMGNALLYLKFFNVNGTQNRFLTGWYMLMSFKHDISANSSFNTEMTVIGWQFMGKSPQEQNQFSASSLLDKTSTEFDDKLNINFPGGNGGAGGTVETFSTRNFNISGGTTYMIDEEKVISVTTKLADGITTVGNAIPPITLPTALPF